MCVCVCESERQDGERGQVSELVTPVAGLKVTTRVVGVTV